GVAGEAGPEGDAVVLLLERVVDEVQAAEGVVLDLRDRANRVALPALVALVEQVFIRAVGPAGAHPRGQDTEDREEDERVHVRPQDGQDPAEGGRFRDHREGEVEGEETDESEGARPDRKSTRLNSSHDQISYAVFC